MRIEIEQKAKPDPLSTQNLLNLTTKIIEIIEE
jgi:hypothetical protein